MCGASVTRSKSGCTSPKRSGTSPKRRRVLVCRRGPFHHDYRAFVLTAAQAKSEEFKAWDFDWTITPDNWWEELSKREKRNVIIKNMLSEGESVSFRSSGWSMWPRIRANDLCTYVAVASAAEVDVGDVVFCQVPPEMRCWSHQVHETLHIACTGEFEFLIGRLDKTHMNGWTTIDKVYGKLVEIVH